MHLKLLQKVQLKKVTEATRNMFGNKIPDKITKISRISPQTSTLTFESKRKRHRI